jgi:hypothetical protein
MLRPGRWRELRIRLPPGACDQTVFSGTVNVDKMNSPWLAAQTEPRPQPDAGFAVSRWLHLASDERLGAYQVTDLSMTTLATLLQVAPSRCRRIGRLRRRQLPLGWAQLIAGWLLVLLGAS